MGAFFRELLIRPLFNALVAIYNALPGQDLGLAIVILTLIIRFLFVPLSRKALMSQRKMAKIQPLLKKLQEKHKNDQQALVQATMALYKEHDANPMSGCLPILIQLPVIFALYRVFITGLDPENLNLLYSFVANPGTLNPIGFGFIDLSMNNHVMAIMAGVGQAIQAWLSLKFQKENSVGDPNNPALKMGQQMLYFFPILIIVISWNLPAGLVLYWIVTTTFAIFEQLYINRKKDEQPRQSSASN